MRLQSTIFLCFIALFGSIGLVRCDTFEDDFHLLFFGQWDTEGNLLNLTIYENFGTVIGVNGKDPSQTPTVIQYAANLTQVFLNHDPDNYYAITHDQLTANLPIYDDGSNCSVAMRLGFRFPSVGSHHISWTLDDDLYFNEVNSRKQLSMNFFTDVGTLAMGNLTLVNQLTNLTISRAVQLGYVSTVLIFQYPGFTNTNEYKFPIAIFDDQLYFLVAALGQNYNAVINFDGVRMDLRDDGNWAQWCASY